MSAAEKLDYQYIRSLVHAVFAPDGSPYSESPMSDWITDKTQDEQSRPRHNYPDQKWNTSVHATESRRPGRSKPLIDKVDPERRRVKQTIERLHWINRAALRYLYDPDAAEGKYRLKALTWELYAPQMKGCNADTKATACMMLDELIPRYRGELQRGVEDEPRQPWRWFPGMTPKHWKDTYLRHWRGLRGAVERVDESILDQIK